MREDHRLQLGERAGELIATSPEAGETSLLALAPRRSRWLVLLPSLTGPAAAGRCVAWRPPMPRSADSLGRTIAVGPGIRPDAAELAERLDLRFLVLAAEPGDSARELWSAPG